MPSKPPPRRRPRVAGTRPTARQDGSAQPGEEPETRDPAASDEQAEQAAPSGTATEPERSRSPQPDAAATGDVDDGGTGTAGEPEHEPELPEEIASAARIERGEDDPAEPERAESGGEPVAAEPLERSEPERAESATDDDSAADEPADGEPAEATAEWGKRRHPWRAATALVIVALLLGGFAAFAAISWGRTARSTGNAALTDADATKQVSTQVSNALNTLLAFDYKNPSKNDKAAAHLIDGKLADCAGSSDKVGYDKLMGVLKKKGPKAQLTLKSTVLKSGVQQLRGDKAQVLVLLDQEYSKGDGKDAQHSSALAAATVNAVNKDGTWQLQRLCLQ